MKIIVAGGVKVANKKIYTISIIIRTKNEEEWIGRCLETVFGQKTKHKLEVIIVDNESTDYTVKIAKRFPIAKLLKIKKFLPGKALNKGIKASKGDYIVCTSAHCIPENQIWIETLVANFTDKTIAGVYGRQLPLSYTQPSDKRDLLITFGLDKRIQEKDYFFHNANSMIPRQVWEKYPFDEKVTNIEDRVWGKKVIQSGLKIIYEPDAAVFHYHGLHQGNTLKRTSGVVSILEHTDSQVLNSLPTIMSPDKINIAAVMPIIGKINKKEIQYLNNTLKDLKKSKFLSKIYYLSDDKISLIDRNAIWINRKLINNSKSLSLNKLLMHSLNLIEKKKDFPEKLLYVNYKYRYRPANLFDNLISDSQYQGLDTLFPGLLDFSHYWYQKDDEYSPTDSSLKPREEREPLYKALYGLGCLFSSWQIRTGKMIGGKVGIYKLIDTKYAKQFQKNN